MIKITAEIASNNVDSQGDRFSNECLEEMKNQINKNSIPITFNFNPKAVIGKTTKAEVKKEKLTVKGEIKKDHFLLNMFLTPGFTITEQEKKGDIREITDANLLEIGATFNPVDQSLKSVEIDKKEK